LRLKEGSALLGAEPTLQIEMTASGEVPEGAIVAAGQGVREEDQVV
jgi:hypothetical protein